MSSNGRDRPHADPPADYSAYGYADDPDRDNDHSYHDRDDPSSSRISSSRQGDLAYRRDRGFYRDYDDPRFDDDDRYRHARAAHHRSAVPFQDDRRPHSRPLAPAKVRDGSPGDSPPPDEDLLAYLRSQQDAAASSSSKLDPDVERLKLERFQQGASAKKSRYQREKEEAERKKKQGEEDAAKAYKDFLVAMEGHDDGHGGDAAAAAGGQRTKPRGFVSAGGQAVYQGSRPAPPPRAAASKKPSLADFGDEPEDEAQVEKPKREPPGKKKRAMDDFLGELQRDQADREKRLRAKVGEGGSISSLLALEGQYVGSRHLGDPMTTNVCVMNLPANVSEDSLGEFFAQWGDVGTVKIMWPRGDEAFGGAGAGITNLRKDRSAGLTGFVAYMSRQDAEYAIKETDGIRWGGSLLKTGWSKAMPLPPRAQYKAAAPASSARHALAPTDGPPHLRAQGPSGPKGGSRIVVKPRRPARTDRSPSPRSVVRTALDDQESLRRRIETVAARVKEGGQRLEDSIRENVQRDPTYAFVCDGESNAHHYYRMCLDSHYQPDLPARPFTDEGYDSLYSTDTGEESEDERMRRLRRGTTLGPLARRRFEAMLRGLTPRRERIAKVTAFAIEHASAADSIATTLCASLLVGSTPVPRKMARLHAISDILHNSAAPVPNAWKYRSMFEVRLPAVFRHLRQVRLSFPGRMKQEGFRRQVEMVLEVWEDWLVFPSESLERLRTEFEHGGAEEAVVGEADRGKAAGMPAEEVDLDGEDLDGEAMPGADKGTAVDEEDLDGEAM